MISKKLWGLVTGNPEPSHLKLFGKKDVTAVVGDDMISINVHELVYKCKEWAWRQDEEHITTTINTRKTLTGLYRVWINEDTEWFAKTEPEAIFKACEWIAKELSK